jgi:hypothetical protein
VLFEEPLDTRLAAERVTSSIDVIARFLYGGSEIVVVASNIDSTSFGIDCSSESTKVFFLDRASWTWTPSHVTDRCDQDPVCSE